MDKVDSKEIKHTHKSCEDDKPGNDQRISLKKVRRFDFDISGYSIICKQYAQQNDRQKSYKPEADGIEVDHKCDDSYT